MKKRSAANVQKNVVNNRKKGLKSHSSSSNEVIKRKATKNHDELNTLLHLAQLAEDSVKNRRVYEWQVNLGFWGGIAGITSTMVAADSLHALWLPCLIYGYLFSLIVYWRWTKSVQAGHAIDREIKHAATRKIYADFDIPEPNSNSTNWTQLFCWITAVLMLWSIAIIGLLQP